MVDRVNFEYWENQKNIRKCYNRKEIKITSLQMKRSEFVKVAENLNKRGSLF